MAVGRLGRMVLSYPTLPADVLAGRPLDRGAALPHLQRLHDRAAQRAGVGLLPARPVLQADRARLELTRVKRDAEAARGGRRR